MRETQTHMAIYPERSHAALAALPLESWNQTVPWRTAGIGMGQPGGTAVAESRKTMPALLMAAVPWLSRGRRCRRCWCAARGLLGGRGFSISLTVCSSRKSGMARNGPRLSLIYHCYSNNKRKLLALSIHYISPHNMIISLQNYHHRECIHCRLNQNYMINIYFLPDLSW